MKISVVMSAWNCEAYVKAAIDSILAQDAEDFECIVVDDGSTDGTAAVLAGYDDPRLRVITLPTNCGHAIGRNIGIRCAQGDYIAIMDADDIALPQRLAVQAAFLDAHPEIHILGTRAIRIRETTMDEIDRPDYALEDGKIKARLLLMNGSAMVDPSSMMRKDYLADNHLWYPPRKMSVDSAFWVQCVAKGARFQSLPTPLIYKRRHGGNVTAVHKEAMEPEKTPIRMQLLVMYYPELSATEDRAIAAIMEEGRPLRLSEICAGVAAVNKALTELRSMYGEDKEFLGSILQMTASRAMSRLKPAA